MHDQDMGEPIKLSDKEKDLIEELLKSTKFGKAKLFLDSNMSKDKDFIHLSKRLKIDFTNVEIEQEKGFFEVLGHLLFSSSSD